jgi:hypothetical protein
MVEEQTHMIRWNLFIFSREPYRVVNSDRDLQHYFVYTSNLQLCIEKCTAVVYRDFLTILWDASLLYRYITKLATSQKSQKPRSPLSQNIILCTLMTLACGRLKFILYHNIVLRGLWKNLQPFKGSLTRDFLLQVFFMNQFPPENLVSDFR